MVSQQPLWQQPAQQDPQQLQLSDEQQPPSVVPQLSQQPLDVQPSPQPEQQSPQPPAQSPQPSFIYFKASGAFALARCFNAKVFALGNRPIAANKAVKTAHIPKCAFVLGCSTYSEVRGTAIIAKAKV